MSVDLHDYRLVTASAYPGMMAPLTSHPSCVCVLSGDADVAGRLSAPIQSLEKLDGVRRRWRFGDVARLADFVPKVLAQQGSDDRPVLLIPPRVSQAWEAAAASWPGHVRLIGRPAIQTGRIAEDKVFVRQVLRGIGVPVPLSVVLAPSEVDFSRAVDALGLPFVLQAPNGAGGQGTYLIRSAEQLSAAMASQPHVLEWLLSRHAGDITINVAGVVHVDGVTVFPASVQSSGISELGVGFGAYCGSDYGAAAQLDPALLRQAHEHTVKVGQWLREIGHLGLFGADIAVSAKTIAFLEVNPRIQGSSWLLSKLQQGPSCLEQHVAALLGAPLGPGGGPIGAGSHLLWRWEGPPGIVRGVPEAGLWEGVTVSGLPAVGTTILPGAIVGRLEAPHSLAVTTGTALPPVTGRLLKVLIDWFDIDRIGAQLLRM